MSKRRTPAISSSKDSTIKGAWIQAGATLLAMAVTAIVSIAGTLYATGVDTNNSALTQQYDTLKGEYDELKAEYNELEKKYEILSSENYMKEYTATSDDVIADQKSRSSFKVGSIYTSSVSFYINNTDPTDEYSKTTYETIDLGEQIFLDKNGEYSLVLKSVKAYDSCQVIIKKN